jgi:hypothetical protein
MAYSVLYVMKNGVSIMKVAIIVWNNRISPVFDVARNIIVLDIAGGSGHSKKT